MGNKRNLFIVIIIILLILICWQLYNLNDSYNKVFNLKNEIKKEEKDAEKFTELLDSIVNEVGDFKKIDNKIGLLERNFKDNEELMGLLLEDLEKVKKQNSMVESKIIVLEEEAKVKENIIKNFQNITYNQFPNYPTGCESVALYILLKYNGVNVNVDDIVNNLKKGELPYEIGGKIYGGNPEVEFVGDPKTRYSYGVYNEPLAEVANMYKKNVISKKGLEFEDMLKIVEEKRPVLVWTTINLSKPYISQTWIYKKTGETIKWISGEHAVVVIGYNNNEVIVSDPYTGMIRYFDKNLFKERYNYLGKRAIYY